MLTCSLQSHNAEVKVDDEPRRGEDRRLDASTEASQISKSGSDEYDTMGPMVALFPFALGLILKCYKIYYNGHLLAAR